ncbi:MAG: hypothetical protein QN834_11705 [Nitrososphaeraceae archaeon]|nr:hypothetical protein [Nitrososphaeraceae archaeon]MDW0225600.1 hypothetical protein [Nitrososphaeraceae archaeon]MDW0272058.1 hypothetical protein [Nitrososphaeraceae archaeon]
MSKKCMSFLSDKVVLKKMKYAGESHLTNINLRGYINRSKRFNYLLFVDHTLSSVDKCQEHARDWWAFSQIGPSVLINFKGQQY